MFPKCLLEQISNSQPAITVQTRQNLPLDVNVTVNPGERVKSVIMVRRGVENGNRGSLIAQECL